ncbi:MAG: hypothetical protein HQL19_03875 [Candidatus Omnitrophica bacterium]|nr:hypothetical protein [Candidatus Omnitrophota bacterium]
MISANIYGWPGYTLKSADIELGLVPDLGGRILSLKFCGEELLFIHPDEPRVLPDLRSMNKNQAFKRDFGFHLWGGDKVWIAPEYAWRDGIPPLDLDAGRYAFKTLEDACVMTSPICRETGLQIVRYVRLEQNGDIQLVDEVHNLSDKPVLRGLWNVTQIKKPFDVYWDADIVNIRSYHLEDPTLPDLKIVPQELSGWAHIPCRKDGYFKFGGNLRQGRIMAVREIKDDIIAFARTFEIDPGAAYAHRSMAEVFNHKILPYGEVEVHAPLTEIPPGECTRFVQSWRLMAFLRSSKIDAVASKIFTGK